MLKPTPLFIFALPRSGSTLLQKMLMTSPNISSANEPWILLPLLSMRIECSKKTNYSHAKSVVAINDFIGRNPGGEDIYREGLRRFVLEMYNTYSINSTQYFLDKTPRYYLIIPEILNLFPDAKFIFLFRNPIEILNSKLRTWHSNRFKGMHDYHIDITEGFRLLANGTKLLDKRAHYLSYQELINNPDQQISRIAEYLNLSSWPSPTIMDGVELKGRLGDPNILNNTEYNRIRNKKNEQEQWKETFNTKLRKKILLNFIKNVDELYLNYLGIKRCDLVQTAEDLTAKAALWQSTKDSIDLIYTLSKRKGLLNWISKENSHHWD